MKLLVTGGAGFIGSNFIHYWLKKYPDDSLINLDKLTYAGNPSNLASLQNNPRYLFVKGDIADRAMVDSLMSQVDTVVHFAAETHVDRSISDAAPFIQTNIIGTHVLLESAIKHSISRFHHISTDEVFGSLELNSSLFTDTTPYAPRSPYAASKAASDHLVRAYGVTYGLPYTITNCSNNFGPYQHPEKMIPLAITNVIEGKRIPLYGDGLNVRDWLYVEDHCSAIDLILHANSAGKTYLVGGQTEDISNRELINTILQIMGKDESLIEYVPDRKGHDRRYAIDWGSISKDLGWKPQYTFKEAIKKTIEWYTNNQHWWKTIKSGEYTEYYRKQYNKSDKA